jgi:hypothetical protein
MPALFTIIFLLFFSLPSHAFHPRVLFDQGHGQAFVIEKDGDLHLSKLAKTFVKQGYEVSSTTHPLNAELLNKTDALIISGAFKPFTSTEIHEIKKFLSRGGRLAVMVHIGPPVLNLLLNLGVDVANGVIREKQLIIDSEPLNFKTSNLRPHLLTKGLEDFSLYGSWPLRPLTAKGEILAYSSSRSWVDLTGDRRQTPGDAIQAFGVLISNRIGKGEILVFGDDAIFQNRFLFGNNRQLAENLGRWVAAEKQPAGQEI